MSPAAMQIAITAGERFVLGCLGLAIALLVVLVLSDLVGHALAIQIGRQIGRQEEQAAARARARRRHRAETEFAEWADDALSAAHGLAVADERRLP